jgi:hypothetical protein
MMKRAVCLLMVPMAAMAQGIGGASLDGFVFDSIRGAPLVGASVRISSIGRPNVSVTTDTAGRFRATGLGAGTHQVSVRHAILDSLGVPAATRKIEVAAGRESYVDLGIPSGRTMLDAVCPGLTVQQRQDGGRNGVIGVVRDAETDAPVARAVVRLSWSVLMVDRSVGIRRMPEFRSTTSDANGLFAICDAPAELDEGILSAFVAGKFDAATAEVSIGSGGVAVQHMYLARREAEAATLVGTILNDQGAPVEGAEILTADTKSDTRADTATDTTAQQRDETARTNAQGMFALSGLRPGTQMIEFRKLGHQRIRRAVSLPSGRATTIEPVTLPTMVAMMAPVTVREKSTAEQFGFSDRMKVGRGHFLTREEILKHRQIMRSGDLIRELIPGMRIEMKSGLMQVTNESLRQVYKGESCSMPIFIDGVPAPADLALDIVPQDIDGVEIYKTPETVPAEFAVRNADGAAPCGAILFWTTWRNRKTPKKP